MLIKKIAEAYFTNRSEKFDTQAQRGQQWHEWNKLFSRVAHDFFSTKGSENGFGCPAQDNEMHFMAC